MGILRNKEDCILLINLFTRSHFLLKSFQYLSSTGDMVEVVYDGGADTTPVYATSDNIDGFTGFRI